MKPTDAKNLTVADLAKVTDHTTIRIMHLYARNNDGVAEHIASVNLEFGNPSMTVELKLDDIVNPGDSHDDIHKRLVIAARIAKGV